jgi:hypothetical protein
VFGNNVTVSGDTSTIPFLESPKTPTPVPPPSWAGDWIIHLTDNFNNPEINLRTIYIIIKQNGNLITSSFERHPGVICNFSTNVNDDSMSALGTMQYGSAGYKIRFYRVPRNINQIQGEFVDPNNQGRDRGLCGGTKGSQPPSPCRP